MFSDFWYMLATGSADLLPDAGFGSAAINGLAKLPSYILSTLGGGALLFDS